MTDKISMQKTEIKKKDDENAKKKELLSQEIELKIELSKLITRRRKIVQKLDVMAEQCHINRSLLADTCKDFEALGHETKRLSQVIDVFEKIETVLKQERAKI